MSNYSFAVSKWFDETIVELGRQCRWSYLPPLMVYFAAGVSGITSIVGAFFVKDYLNLSAAFLSGLAFWAGIPWALKMPLGHLVDIIWRWKHFLVYLGAIIIASSICIIYGLIRYPDEMAAITAPETWYVISVLLAPTGYVIQDTVADAMTVEAVPLSDENGARFTESQTKQMHTTMQTLGRIAIVLGFISVAALNISMFANVQSMPETIKLTKYASIYQLALLIPIISVVGVTLGILMSYRRRKSLISSGVSSDKVESLIRGITENTPPDYRILGGGLIFVILTIGVGVADIPFCQEIVFICSLLIIAFLIKLLVYNLESSARRQLLGTAIIIFVFRAVPLPGPGATWWEIDVLAFDQQFLSVLTLITSVIALIGMLVIRPLVARKSLAYVVFLLTIAAGFLSLPNIGLYYGLHHWTEGWSQGIIDARFIAILDTALESPLGQIAMIPMLAWIAKNAPQDLKATFFAVMASFTNLALSASSLSTKYLNRYFTIEREVRDPVSGSILVNANYDDLGKLIVVVAVVTVVLPLLTILIVQNSRFQTGE